MKVDATTNNGAHFLTTEYAWYTSDLVLNTTKPEKPKIIKNCTILKLQNHIPKNENWLQTKIIEIEKKSSKFRYSSAPSCPPPTKLIFENISKPLLISQILSVTNGSVLLMVSQP